MAFNYVYKWQCLIDGSAYFGIKHTNDISWGEDTNPWRLGIKASTKRMQAKIAQHGWKPWRLQIIMCTTEPELAARELKKILDATQDHPLSLNWDKEAAKEASIKNLEIATPAATAANLDVPRPPEVKKRISKAMKKHHEKQAAANVPNPGGEAVKDMVAYHNPETKEQIMLYAEEEPITGFIKGRLPKA